MSKYQQSRMAGSTRAKSTNNRTTRQRQVSQSIQLGVSLQKPSLDKQQQLYTPNQQSFNTNAVQQATIVKTLKSQRQPKFQQNDCGKSSGKPDEKGRDRQTRSSDQKSKPTLAAASRKGMSMRKSKFNKSQIVTNFNQQLTSKSQHNSNFDQKLKQKSHSIESHTKLIELDNKENYPSNSSLHHKSKPLSEQSKSVSAGRSRGGRRAKLGQDLSISSLSDNSQNGDQKAMRGSVSKMLGKQYFLDGEKCLNLLSPGAPTRSENPKKRHQLDAKMLSYSRGSSPQKIQSRHKVKSEDGFKQSIDSKSGNDIRRVKNGNTQMTSLNDLSKQKQKTGSTTEKQVIVSMLKKLMEDTQRTHKKTDRDQQRIKESDAQKMQEILSTKARKKKRSKSCISKIGEGVFSARDQIRDRSKESANKTCLLSEAISGSIKRHGGKGESVVTELNIMHRELQQEIAVERGHFDRSVVTPFASKPANNCGSNKSNPRKPSTGGGNYTSLRIPDTSKNLIQSQVQCDKLDKRGTEIDHSKIRKYIERQKKQAIAKKSIRETIEHEKHIKVKETLMELQKFNKTGKKRLSKPVNALRFNANTLNIKSATKDLGLNSTQQIELLNHVRAHLPSKKKQAKKKQTIQVEASMPNDDYGQESSRTFTGELLAPLNEESQIINIFRKELQSSKSNSLRHHGRDQSPQDSDVEYPLKELKPQVGSATRQKKSTSLKVNPLNQPTNNCQRQGSDNFESLEPSRYPSDNHTTKHRSTPKYPSTIYDKSETNQHRKQRDTQDQAAVTIQKWMRGFLDRKYFQRANSKKSSPFHNTTDQNNTAGSIRKMNIPSLNLQKINSSDSHHNPYANQKPPKETQSHSARSNPFDRTAFQHSDKPLLPQGDLELPELIKVREQAIKAQEEQEQKRLQLQLDHNKVSPRTFQRKQLELEVWVTKETTKINQAREKYESERMKDRQEQYLKNVVQDYEQINKILGSARSSQKSKHPHIMANENGLLASSARDGINSFRVDSTRKSHRVNENQYINLIYEKQSKPQNESSSQSRGQKKEAKVQDQSASQKSQSHNYGSSYRSQTDSNENVNWANEDGEVPNLNEVTVPVSKHQRLTLDAIEQQQMQGQPSEKSLNRQLSQKRLNEESPRHLSKTDARTKLLDEVDEEEAELSRQVMEVSPSHSEDDPRNNLKDELKQSLKSDNFFLNKMDSTASNGPLTENKQSNIRIETGDESQPPYQSVNPALIGTISPLSGASSDFGIQRGGMSLESSTSGENRDKLASIISEIQQDARLQQLDEIRCQTSLSPDLADYADALASEIMQLLVAETMEFDLLVNREAAQQLRNQQQQQEQMQQLQQLQGIKTDLFAIERYVDEVVAEINLNSAEFLKTLNTPIPQDNLEQLKLLQNTDLGTCAHFEDTFPQALPLDLYLTLEKRRKETRERTNAVGNAAGQINTGSQTDMMRILIAECEHIHNKVLFDCINDSLVQFKPYGKDGEPQPWTRKNRRLKPTDDFSVQEIFEIVKHDLFRWAITQAGTLPRREFVYRGVFDEELFSEIREKKLVALLQREMIETEPRWLNYEFEQAQVKIDLGDMILQMLVDEAVKALDLAYEEQDYSSHPLMMQTLPLKNEEKRQQRELEAYEAHILRDIGVGGTQGRRQSDNSPERSGYNSKDSDFSNNFEGSEAGDDFGGNQSQSSQHEDEF